MYNSTNKQYVFKQANGPVINLFYDNRYGLCYSTLTRRNTWTEPTSLQKNIHPTFFADIDADDQIHIYFQDINGNLLYSQLHRGSIKTTPMLNSKAALSYEKYLNLLAFKNIVHFFFVLQYNNSSILSHQILDNGNVGTPKVIDYIINNGRPFSLEYDKSGNLYVFYQLSDNKYSQIGYKKYNPSQKSWGEFIPITRNSIDSELPATIIDDKDIIHLIYQRHSERQYELIYMQKVPDKNMWTSESVIHVSSYPFEQSSVLMIKNELTIFWVRSDAIYYSFSVDDGNVWSKPAAYKFPIGKQLICIGFKSNKSFESDKLIIKDIPGSFINGLKLAFYQVEQDNTGNLSAGELRDMIVESLRLLKGSVEELKDADTGIKDNILRLEALYENFEKEIVKSSLKLNLLESEVNRLKSLESRLDYLQNSLIQKVTPAVVNENEKELDVGTSKLPEVTEHE